MKEHDGQVEDSGVAEPFRWASPREIIEGGPNDSGGGISDPGNPSPIVPSEAAQLN